MKGIWKKVYVLIFVVTIFLILFSGALKIICYNTGNKTNTKIANEQKIEKGVFGCGCIIDGNEKGAKNDNETEKIALDKEWNLLSVNEMKEIIANGTNWMKNAQEENGHFKYEYYPIPGLFSDDDNMVRQTGAIFVLGEILKRDSKNKYELKNTIERAISYVEENSHTGDLNGQKFRCVLRSSKICSLGATSLALIGIVDLIEVYPETITKYGKLLNDYLDFVLAMKKENGGFRGNFYLDTEQSERESDFSSGEAFLALTKYYNYKPIQEIKDVIDNSYGYFEDKYSGNPNNNFYLWGMAGVKELYQLEPDIKYYDFVKKYTDWRISFYKGLRNTTRNKCAYIEGVISAYSILEPNLKNSEKSYYEEEIGFWLSKMRDLQVGDEFFLDVIVGGSEMEVAIINPNIAFGGFLTGINIDHISQRIDFTQHCLSSYLQKLVDIDGVSL